MPFRWFVALLFCNKLNPPSTSLYLGDLSFNLFILRNFFIACIYIFVYFFSVEINAKVIIAFWEFCPESITNKYIYSCFCFLFISPVVKFCDFIFDFLQQVNSNLFDSLDILGCKILREQHIIHRKFFVTWEPFTNITLFFHSHAGC